MKRDDIIELLKEIGEHKNIIDQYYASSAVQEKAEALARKVHSEQFWQDPDQITISKKHQEYKEITEKYSHLSFSYQEAQELFSLYEGDEKSLSFLCDEIKKLLRKMIAFKIELLLSGEKDKNNCFLTINMGAGGTESQDWALMLLRMYQRFCERSGLSTSLLDYQDGEEAGIKSATLFIKGKNSYGLLKSEHGIHRLVRISPFDAAKRRHTSFAGVFVVPEVEEKKIEILESDLRIDTYRAGGAGGQHVNKTDSAVRITHLPTGIVVQCQNERSQMQNKQQAFKMLAARLQDKLEEEKQAAQKTVEKKKIEWGSQCRSYVLHPYKMVKDHRTSKESPVPDQVLDGDLQEFIEAYLIQISASSS